AGELPVTAPTRVNRSTRESRSPRRAAATMVTSWRGSVSLPVTTTAPEAPGAGQPPVGCHADRPSLDPRSWVTFAPGEDVRGPVREQRAAAPRERALRLQ